MVFCTQCGANVPEGMKFCTECGAHVETAQQPVTVMAAPEPVYQNQTAEPQPAYQQPLEPLAMYTQPPEAPPQAYNPPPTYAPPPQPNAQQTALMPPDVSPVLGTGAFIGFSILFAIPVIGWLACIILSFTGGNLNRRNFARSRLFFLILGLVSMVVMYFVFRWVYREVVDYLNKVSDGAFSDSGGLRGILDIFN